MSNADREDADARRLQISLELTSRELAQLDEWIASSSDPERSQSDAARAILLAALEFRERSSERADRLTAADNAFAAHLRSKGFLPE